jgi:DNA polymerase (family 10)
MPVHNNDIVEIFNELADLLEIRGANEFRVRAYRKAARTVGDLPGSVAAMIDDGEDLSELPGIGEDLASKIAEIVETGSLGKLEEVREEVDPALSKLMKLRGLGPKKVKALHDELDVSTAEDLREAAEAERIRRLEGFGAKTERNILEVLEKAAAGGERRFRLNVADQYVGPLVEYLEGCQGVKTVVAAGSYRRRKDTVGDLDILVTQRRDADVMDHFVEYDDVESVISKGETRSSVELRGGLQVDLRVVPQVSYGAALYYFTGSKPHNIAVRKIAAGKGLKVNEYGIFDGDERIAGRTEEEVFETLDLPFIEPELREDRGELDAARAGELPDLVTLDDIRGDLHTHTKVTDGRASLEDMARAAVDRGYEYIAVTDHSQHVSVAQGLDDEGLAKHVRRIRDLDDEMDAIALLASIEVDVLEDGSLDLSDDVLDELDLVVCSIHYKLDLPEKEQTERLLRAMDNPRVTIVGHPTGRLINEREPCALDMRRVLEHARDIGCIMELNAHPDRLDLDDAHLKMAKDLGVQVAVSTDAHAVSDFEFIRYGVGQARRGWLEAGDVVNTLELDDLVERIGRR